MANLNVARDIVIPKDSALDKRKLRSIRLVTMAEAIIAQMDPTIPLNTLVQATIAQAAHTRLMMFDIEERNGGDLLEGSDKEYGDWIRLSNLITKLDAQLGVEFRSTEDIKNMQGTKRDTDSGPRDDALKRFRDYIGISEDDDE